MDAERRIDDGTFTKEVMERIASDGELRHGRLIQVTYHRNVRVAVLTFEHGRRRERIFAPKVKALRFLEEVGGRRPKRCVGIHFCYTAVDDWLVSLDKAEVADVADR